MKPFLFAFALLSFFLCGQSGRAADAGWAPEIGWAAEPVPSGKAATTHVVAAATDRRMPSPGTRTQTVQVAAIAAPGAGFGNGPLRDAPLGRDEAVAEGLPSTPIALASLFLIICILIGRRNS